MWYKGKHVKAPYTIFNETKMVEVEVYKNGYKTEDTTWEEELWVERGEDWYALGSSQLKNKRVRVIRREEWLRGKKL